MIAPGDSLRDFYTNVYAPLRLRGKSKSTQRQYVIQINHFSRYLGREPALADLTDDTVSGFLASLLESGRAAPTANKARSHLLALWRLAARKRYVATDPDVPPAREPRRIPKAWSLDELDKLFRQFERLQGTIGGVPESLWWKALHQVLWWTGERIGAVMQLEWENFDERTGWLIIPAEIRKMKTADRIFKLPEEAIAALAAIHGPTRKQIFPFPYSPKMLWRRYQAILQAAGLPTDRKSKFHRMRKTCASHYKAAGGNATELLDHSNSRVTESYIDPTIAPPAQPADKLPPPRKPQQPGA